MSPLELALVILISIWSLIFIIIAIALLVLLREVKQALDKINRILTSAEKFTEGVGGFRAAANGIIKLLGKRKKG